MSVLTLLKETTTQLFNSSIGAKRKFFSLSHLFHTPTIVVLLSLTFSYAISLFDTQFLHLSTLPIVINFNVATNFYLKLIRVAMVLTAFLNVIPVSHISWF